MFLFKYTVSGLPEVLMNLMLLIRCFSAWDFGQQKHKEDSSAVMWH